MRGLDFNLEATDLYRSYKHCYEI